MTILLCPLWIFLSDTTKKTVEFFTKCLNKVKVKLLCKVDIKFYIYSSRSSELVYRNCKPTTQDLDGVS